MKNSFWTIIFSIINRVLSKNIRQPAQETKNNLQPEALDVNEDEVVPHVVVDFDEDVLYVDTDGLNVRKTPSKNNKPLDVLIFGEKVEVIEKGEYWFRVNYRDDKKGWVASQYLTEENPKTSTSEARRELSKNFPIFKKGRPNLARDENTKVVREFINKEFVFDYKTIPLQCTEYVQYKVLKELEVRINWAGRVGSRNGGDWPGQFTKLKRYRVFDEPKKGRAMSFANPNFNKPYGHVAFVEEVSDSDKSIKISEVNWPSKGIYNERPLSKEQWSQKWWGAKFIDFT